MLSRTVRNAVLLLLVLALAAPLVSAQEGQKVVTMVLTSDPPSFDPHGSLGPAGPILLEYIYDTLLHQTEDDEIEPLLAESWSVEDEGHTVTFHLRDDVRFSNGAPVNADAVIYTFQRLQEVGRRSLIYGEISNITEFERVDEYTVRFHLAEPSAALLSALTYSYAGILEPGAVEAAGEDYGSQPVGSGPFMLAEWIPQNTMTLVPNPNYNGHRPFDESPDLDVDELRVRFTTDQTTRINALLSGEVDIAYITSAPLLEPVRDNPDFRILDVPTRGMIYVGFNTGSPPFDDVSLRQAVAHATQKQDILTIAADSMGVLTNTPLPPTIFGYDPALEAERLAYDPDAARALLADAGYTPENPLAVRLLTLTSPTYQTIATVLQAQLAEVGIAANIEALDYGGLLSAMNDGDYDMVVLRYGWNDPDVLRVYLSEAAIGGSNRYFYANPEFDALVAEGRRAFDPEARLEAYREAQRILMTDVPWLPLYVPVTSVVVNNRVQNVEVVHSYVTLENAEIRE